MNQQVRQIVNKNRHHREKTLNLSYKNLFFLPNEIREHSWITDLVLRGNLINKIRPEEFPPNLQFLSLCHNSISDMVTISITNTIVELDLNSNKLVRFDGDKFPKLKVLKLGSNLITDFKSFPPNLEECDLYLNRIKELPKLNSNLKVLDVSGNRLESLPELNEVLKELDISNNLFTELPMLTNSIEDLDFSQNDINEISTDLPSSLVKLKGTQNGLRDVKVMLPAGLEELDLSDNELDDVPMLPTDILVVKVRDNKIVELGDIPDTVVELDCSNNFISEIPDELKKSTLKIKYDGNNCAGTDEEDFFNLFDNNSDSDSKFEPFAGTGHKLGNSYGGYGGYGSYGGHGSYNYNGYSSYGNYYGNINRFRSSIPVKSRDDNPYYIKNKRTKVV